MLERMINKRLIWYLKLINYLLNTKVASEIKEVKLIIIIIIAIFFNVEKAYDMTWRYSIMKDFYNVGLKVRFPNFFMKKFQGTSGYHPFWN